MEYSAYFADKRFKDSKLQEKKSNCAKAKHDWSSWACVPSGLGRTCRTCDAVETLTSEKLKEIWGEKSAPF